MRDFFINQVFDGNLLIAMFVAAIAGLISFFSPCVIPLVPGYISYATGMSDTKSRSRVFLGSILFVSGFTVLFISYGLLFGGLGSQIFENSRTISVVLGFLIIALGLMFLFSEKFYRSYKPAWKTRTGLVFAPFLGFAFGIGWTPCIGPTLGAVQVLAFILTGLFLDKVEPLRKFIMRKGNLVTKVGGVILILIGVLQVSNFWDTLMNSMRDLISGFIPIL